MEERRLTGPELFKIHMESLAEMGRDGIIEGLGREAGNYITNLIKEAQDSDDFDGHVKQGIDGLYDFLVSIKRTQDYTTYEFLKVLSGPQDELVSFVEKYAKNREETP